MRRSGEPRHTRKGPVGFGVFRVFRGWRLGVGPAGFGGDAGGRLWLADEGEGGTADGGDGLCSDAADLIVDERAVFGAPAQGVELACKCQSSLLTLFSGGDRRWARRANGASPIAGLFAPEVEPLGQ